MQSPTVLLLEKKAGQVALERSGVDIAIGDFVEVAASEGGRTWLASVSAYREVATDDDRKDCEVKCLWLWYPEDVTAEYPNSGLDIDTYGKHEVLLGTAEDWNSVGSVMEKAQVLRYDTYCRLDKWQPDTWYYRQEFNPDSGVITPSIPSVVKCPKLKAKAGDPWVLKLRNPESSYFKCIKCNFLFQSPDVVKFVDTGGPPESFGLVQGDGVWKLKEPKPRVAPSAPDETFDCGCEERSLRVVKVAVDFDLDETEDPPAAADPNDSDFDATNLTDEEDDDVEEEEVPASDDDLPDEITASPEATGALPSPSPPAPRRRLRKIMRSETSGEQKGTTRRIFDTSSSSEPSDSSEPDGEGGFTPATASATEAAEVSAKGAKGRRVGSSDLPTPVVGDDSGVSEEDEKQALKLEKFREIFETARREMEASGTEEQIIFPDLQQLARLAVHHVEVYCRDQSITGKMAHQRMHERYQNLKRPQNENLRRRILTGEFSLEGLASADSKELAPDFLKRKRQEEAERYFQQQVLLQKGPERVIRKTHKGLEALHDDAEEAITRHTHAVDLDEEPGDVILPAAARTSKRKRSASGDSASSSSRASDVDAESAFESSTPRESPQQPPLKSPAMLPQSAPLAQAAMQEPPRQAEAPDAENFSRSRIAARVLRRLNSLPSIAVEMRGCVGSGDLDGNLIERFNEKFETLNFDLNRLSFPERNPMMAEIPTKKSAPEAAEEEVAEEARGAAEEAPEAAEEEVAVEAAEAAAGVASCGFGVVDPFSSFPNEVWSEAAAFQEATGFGQPRLGPASQFEPMGPPPPRLESMGPPPPFAQHLPYLHSTSDVAPPHHELGYYGMCHGSTGGGPFMMHQQHPPPLPQHPGVPLASSHGGSPAHLAAFHGMPGAHSLPLLPTSAPSPVAHGHHPPSGMRPEDHHPRV